jgi:hypothetical protein
MAFQRRTLAAQCHTENVRRGEARSRIEIGEYILEWTPKVRHTK